MSQVMVPQLEQFRLKSDFHAKLWEYFIDPERLEEVDMKKGDNKAQFVKTANKIMTAYMKRVDMALFNEPVDTNTYKDYLIHVEKPMDYSTIKFKLNNNGYDN